MHIFAGLITSSLLASYGALAQQTTGNSLIPSGISSQCNDFMVKLNSDSKIQTCTSPLLQATSFYANATANAASSTSNKDSSDALTQSLTQLCSADAGCQSDLIRKYLNEFWGSCNAEIKAKNKGVQDVYDVLYLINPFHNAVCTKDDSDNYCILNIASYAAKNATGATRRSLHSDDDLLSTVRREAAEHRAALVRRQNVTGDDAGDTAASIDTSSLSTSNIAFLFLQPTAEKDVLCTSCGKNILAAYIQFETSIPYAIGLSNSDILKGQSDLYQSMKTTCGDDFTTSVNQVAGTTAFATVGGATASLGGAKTWTAMAAFMAAAGALLV